jgi:hypothetical protein
MKTPSFSLTWDISVVRQLCVIAEWIRFVIRSINCWPSVDDMEVVKGGNAIANVEILVDGHEIGHNGSYRIPATQLVQFTASGTASNGYLGRRCATHYRSSLDGLSSMGMP